MKTTKEKVAIMQAYLDGKQLQIETGGDERVWVDFCDSDEPEWNWMSRDYRIKPLEFPKLPEGMEWHNKHGLTSEQVGEGWRLLTRDEIESCVGRNRNDVHRWENGKWCNNGGTGYAGTIPDFTYRIPSSVPFPKPPNPKVMVPLEAEDVSFGDVVRCGAHTWHAVHGCIGGKMIFPNGSTLAFETAKNNQWQIKRPGEDWKPCEKESTS